MIEPPEGCTCQGCGRKYLVDVMVPDALWQEISRGVGLLCGPCICARIEAVGAPAALALVPVEPDEATVDAIVGAINAALRNGYSPSSIAREAHRAAVGQP